MSFCSPTIGWWFPTIEAVMPNGCRTPAVFTRLAGATSAPTTHELIGTDACVGWACAHALLAPMANTKTMRMTNLNTFLVFMAHLFWDNFSPPQIPGCYWNLVPRAYHLTH